MVEILGLRFLKLVIVVVQPRLLPRQVILTYNMLQLKGVMYLDPMMLVTLGLRQVVLMFMKLILGHLIAITQEMKLLFLIQIQTNYMPLCLSA